MLEVSEFGKLWRQIPGREGYYASKDGEILSFAKSRNKPRVLQQIVSADGHKYVFTYRDKMKSKIFVHRAVLMAWVGLPEDGQVCRHLNDDPADNTLENLCWGTIQDNAQDCIRNGHRPAGENAAIHKLTSEQVLEIRKRYAGGESSSVLSSEFGVAQNTILVIARGEKWAHLPTFENEAKHSSARKTATTEDHYEKFAAGRKAYTAGRRKPRMMVPCACGCGTMIETPDKKGRDRRYAQGHNQAGRSWRWKK